MTWIDTGLLVKLYTPEPQTSVLETWIETHPECLPLMFSGLHETELASALAAKVARGEITSAERAEVWRDILADAAAPPLTARLASRISRPLSWLPRMCKGESLPPPGPQQFLLPVCSPWERVFRRASVQAAVQGVSTKCRALDTLHVAAALEMHARLLLSSDARQLAMAVALGLPCLNPFASF